MNTNDQLRFARNYGYTARNFPFVFLAIQFTKTANSNLEFHISVFLDYINLSTNLPKIACLVLSYRGRCGRSGFEHWFWHKPLPADVPIFNLPTFSCATIQHRHHGLWTLRFLPTLGNLGNFPIFYSSRNWVIWTILWYRKDRNRSLSMNLCHCQIMSSIKSIFRRYGSFTFSVTWYKQQVNPSRQEYRVV